MRRFALLAYLFAFLVQLGTAVMDLYWGHGGGRLDGAAPCAVSLGMVALPMVWMWGLRRNASVMSWDDRAQMDFGVPYVQLSQRHQFDVRVRVSREVRAGNGREDERDMELQRQAERQAFRVLKVTMPVVLVVYWVVCLWLPAGEMKMGMVVSAVLLSCVTAFVILLPDVIRLWTQPDAVREMSVAEPGGQA